MKECSKYTTSEEVKGNQPNNDNFGIVMSGLIQLSTLNCDISVHQLDTSMQKYTPYQLYHLQQLTE